MKKYYFLFCLFTYFSSISIAQVGVNTNNPQAMLDVVGSVKTDGKLFVENPGSSSQIRNAELLVRKGSNEIIKYDIDNSKYGPINFAEFNFSEVNTSGLQDFDTKISTVDYIVTIQGFSFFEHGTSDPNIVLKSDINNNNIEGYQVYAYKNSTTNTWWLRAFGNNSKFRIYNGLSVTDTSIDLYLNLIIYRNGFITKEQSSITVNMGDSETATAPLPTGF